MQLPIDILHLSHTMIQGGATMCCLKRYDVTRRRTKLLVQNDA